MNNQILNRQVWADYVKAIAIFSMVLCHAGVGSENPNLCMFIYTFHMPVFFLLSGYFEKCSTGNSLSKIILLDFKRLIIPYILFNLFAFTYCWYGMLNHPELNGNITARQILPHGLLGILTFQLSQTDYSFLPNGVLWFLISLFECKMFFLYFTSIYSKSKILYFFSLVVYSLVGYKFISNHHEIFVLGPTFLAFPFFYLGYFLKQTDIVNKLNTNKSFLLFVCCFLLLYVLYPMNGRPDIASVWFGNNIFLFYLNAVLGSAMCIGFTRCLNPINCLSYLGKHTMEILCLHVLFIMIGKRVIDLLPFINSYSLVYCALVALFGILFSLLFGTIILRKWPWMLGKIANKKY